MREQLGTIHQLLYRRICFLSEWNEELCLQLQVLQKYPFHKQQLESLIDERSVHECLQEMILQVQQEHASLAEKAKAVRGCAALKQVMDTLAAKHMLHGEIPQLLDEIKSKFLHGMPCDRSLVIQQKDASSVAIQWKNDTQAAYFHDASLWYWQRQYLIQNMLPNGYVYEECAASAMLYQTEDADTWIKQLEQEHAVILRILDAMHAQCLTILQTKMVDTKWLAACIRYLQEYADVYHHQKEETLVFSRLQNATPQGKILVEQGMLVEHDMARYYIRSMKKLLTEDVNDDICVRWIGYLQAYMDLLYRHIEKENEVAYPYAARVLTQEELQKEFDKLDPYASMDELERFLHCGVS